MNLAAVSRADLWALAFVPLLVLGIHWMRSPRTAARGNTAGAAGLLGLVMMTLYGRGLWANPAVWAGLTAGGVIGVLLAVRVRMIQMPELVALFNGLGGAASAIVALIALAGGEGTTSVRTAALLAVAVGALTFSGSAIAVLKLARVLGPRPIVFRGQGPLNLLLVVAMAAFAFAGFALEGSAVRIAGWGALAAGLFAGCTIMARVGGADMPVSISFLNALTGVAAAVAGFAVGNPAAVAVGALVGAGGLMLTRVMCRAMNRGLLDVLTGRSILAGRDRATVPATDSGGKEPSPSAAPEIASAPADPIERLRAARRVAILPGYGMALGQAQQAVKRLYDALTRRGVEVEFGIHPVAGRMPGHMHILLAEVEIPYERFREMDEINPRLPDTDVALVVGANDVVNPAASTTEGTPISGMPVIRAEAAKCVIVCNLDRKPGYAGVPNPLYDRPNTILCLGNAAETIARFAAALEGDPSVAG